MNIFSRRARLGDAWVSNVRMRVSHGKIAAVASGAVPLPGDVVVDTLLPALANLHSHSFQRAMAGMTEYSAQDRESFWTRL